MFSYEGLNVNIFTQEVYRNIKVYDHLIAFIINNKQMMKLVRNPKAKEVSKEVESKSQKVKEIFRK